MFRLWLGRRAQFGEWPRLQLEQAKRRMIATQVVEGVTRWVDKIYVEESCVDLHWTETNS